MLDLFVKYFSKQLNPSICFNYSEERRMTHFKQMYKKFQALKKFGPQKVSFEQLKPVELGALVEKSNGRTLILDLDETLIYCSAKCSNLDAIPIPGLSEGQIAYVHKRPFLDEFLSKVSKQFTVIVYSAAMDQYVQRVVSGIDPHGKYIKAMIGRSGCVKLDENVMLKSMDLFKQIDLQKCVIVENNPQCFAQNLDNVIPIVSFNGDMMDTELENLRVFLENLIKKKDFRVVLRRAFQLESFLVCTDMQKLFENMLSQSTIHQKQLSNLSMQ